MKIIQILPRMNIGGVERGVIDIVKYFKDSDICNAVISGGGDLIPEIEKQNTVHYKLPVYKKSLSSFFLVSPVKQILKKEKAEILHARSRVPAWIGFFATRNTNCNFITTAHGVYSNRFFSEPMGWGKFVICPSKTVARHMKEKFGVPEDKIVIINRWVDLDKFKFTDCRKKTGHAVIASVGRISPSKGYEHLIGAFKKLIRFNPYLKLKIVGSPDKTKMAYFNHLKNLVNRYSLEYNVDFLGFRDDVENVLREASILVAPSVEDESFGRVIVEAFACGVPVIATRVGGFSEVIDDGKDGILIEPGKSEAIAENILRILKDGDFAAGLAANGRKKAETLYSMEECLKQTRQVYIKTASFTRILVVKISSLGDLILSLPSLKAIKESFPNGKLCILTLKKYSPLFYGCPYVDEIISLPDDYKKMKNILRVSKELRRASFDYIADLQNSKVSHLISFLSQAKYSLGFSLRWGFLMGVKVKYSRNDSPLVSQEKILNLMGVEVKDKKLCFWDIKEESKLLPAEGNFIGINVSASAKWESKNWPLKNIAHLAETVHKNLPSFKIVLVGDDSCRKRAGEIEAMLNTKPVNLCGKTSLSELPAALKRLKVFISADTANLHLSCAVGTETIGIFGPTDPTRHTVENKKLHILKADVPCLFCYKAKCPGKEPGICMEKITPQQVFSLIKEILAG